MSSLLSYIWRQPASDSGDGDTSAVDHSDAEPDRHNPAETAAPARDPPQSPAATSSAVPSVSNAAAREPPAPAAPPREPAAPKPPTPLAGPAVPRRRASSAQPSYHPLPFTGSPRTEIEEKQPLLLFLHGAILFAAWMLQMLVGTVTITWLLVQFLLMREQRRPSFWDTLPVVMLIIAAVYTLSIVLIELVLYSRDNLDIRTLQRFQIFKVGVSLLGWLGLFFVALFDDTKEEGTHVRIAEVLVGLIGVVLMQAPWLLLLAYVSAVRFVQELGPKRGLGLDGVLPDQEVGLSPAEAQPGSPRQDRPLGWIPFAWSFVPFSSRAGGEAGSSSERAPLLGAARESSGSSGGALV